MSAHDRTSHESNVLVGMQVSSLGFAPVDSTGCPSPGFFMDTIFQLTCSGSSQFQWIQLPLVLPLYIYIYVVTSGSKDKIRLDLKALATRMKAIL